MTVKKDKYVTVADAQQHVVTTLAAQYWAPFTKNHKAFESKLVDTIYTQEIRSQNAKSIALLEFSHYLEHYLWPNFSHDASVAYYLSIVTMVNEKFKERTDAWKVFQEKPELFPDFMRGVLCISLYKNNMEEALIAKAPFLKGSEVTVAEKVAVVTFLQNSFNSVEIDIVRSQMSKLASMHTWANLLPSQREDIFSRSKKLRKYWNTKIEPEFGNEPNPAEAEFERTFLWKLIEQFKETLANVDNAITSDSDELNPDEIFFCERFLALMVDLEALLPTRRFFNAVIHASHLLTHCTLSELIRTEMGTLFCQLVQMLKLLLRYDIDDVTGQPLNRKEVAERHHNHVLKLQQTAFKFFRDSMEDFALLNVGSVDSRAALTKQFNKMSKKELYRFAECSNLVPSSTENENVIDEYSKEFLTETLILHCERRADLLQQLNDQALYPTEKVIWDRNMIPFEHFSQDRVLALDKLNLQFLTIGDYLMRNFKLFQMESTYEIRQDLEDVLFRMRPWKHETRNETIFGGWARMALKLEKFEIVEVDKPNVGQSSPSSVKANFTVHVGKRQDIRGEWDSLRKHDVCFFVTLRATVPAGSRYDPRKPLEEQMEIIHVRGCEVEGMLDKDGKVIEEYASYERKNNYQGDTRSYRVTLDTNQYRVDMENHEKNGEDVYTTFNMVMRRDPKTNNFKAVLSTIRDLLNTDCVIPDWLKDVVIGFGNPAAAHYSMLNTKIPTMDFNDTFLNWEHLVASFPEHKVVAEAEESKMVPPFKLTFKDLASDDGEKVIEVEPVVPISRTPYPIKVNSNSVRFTPSQVEAVKAGMQPGLSMIVGPPGTGKTDVAVQIISNIYHNWPNQRTLVVTHSNQALNQLFEKIIALDVDERHLLRMGHGEESLETEKDFSRYGRVNHVLKERLRLLTEVEKLQTAMGVVGDVSYSCDNAGHFFRFTVCLAWDKFLETTASQPDCVISEVFPFTAFFADLPEMFSGDREKDLEVAQTSWRHIKNIFEQLEEFRAFELLRNGRDRTHYLLVKEAKIIAMTCTHAALRRQELVDLGFRYDNILMEEAAQILEVETFIPLLLQNPQDGRSRLKRWIMIGDHNQLPPIVQNRAFQKYSNMEQSLFARFVRLGVPHTLLDAQGRARADIASLYSWRYKQLGNLPHIADLPQFHTANAGFAFSYQLIDIPDFNGVGESEPSQYFYQNLGEAEYAVALFTYMRILGYPAEKISIITTYNGQAQLIRDVVAARCAQNPLIGEPHKISTVDKYQGQQNDYIILSLVRTAHIGHIRDVRRLIVALSRARLGLYVLGRADLFRNCLELQPAFEKLCSRPGKLILIPSEPFPTMRKVTERAEGEPFEIVDTVHLCHFVHEFYMSNVEAMKTRYQQALAAQEEKMKEQEEAEEEHMEEGGEEKEDTAEEDEETPKLPLPPQKKKPGEDETQDIVFEEMDFERLEEMPKY